MVRVCICCFKHSFLLICSMPWPSCICLRSSLIQLFLWASDCAPEPLCLSSSHFFIIRCVILISARKQIMSEYLSLTKSSEQFFFITLYSVFGYRCLQQFAHDASLSTESSKMSEELWLINWLKGFWWRNINKPPHPIQIQDIQYDGSSVWSEYFFKLQYFDWYWHHTNISPENPRTGSTLSPFFFASGDEHFGRSMTMMFANDIVICSESRE